MPERKKKNKTIRIFTNIHQNDMRYKGEQIGLTGKALQKFSENTMYALNLSVDSEGNIVGVKI